MLEVSAGGEVYGLPRVWAELVLADGERIGGNRVERLDAPGRPLRADQGGSVSSPSSAPPAGARKARIDNAVAESFFATLEKELIHRQSWPTRAQLRTEVFDYIEAFYNRQRRPRPPCPPRRGNFSGLRRDWHPDPHRLPASLEAVAS